MKVYIGFDSREPGSFAVCRNSIKQYVQVPTRIEGLVLEDLRERGLYTRIHDRKDGQLFDRISDAPMSTEFAISRFLVPHLNNYSGFAVFMDSDMMLRCDINMLFAIVNNDPGKAVYCVKHSHNPSNAVKMDDQLQTLYKRKNWSSFMLFNCGHEKHKILLDLVNSVPGRDLHAFDWLEDDEIGELPPEWNYLVGHTKLNEGTEPNVVHWTDGSPEFPQYRHSEYSDEWFKILRDWAK